jgi:hypothetical protein
MYKMTSKFLLIILLAVFSLKAESSVPDLLNSSGSFGKYSKYRKDVGINIDFGLNGSGDYQSVLKDYYHEEISGGFLWLSLGIGLDFRLINNFYIQPRITWLTNTVSVPSLLSGYNNEKVNDILLSGISAKYYIFFGRTELSKSQYLNFGLYLNGGIYKCSPSTELSDLKFNPARSAKNLSVGLHTGAGIGSINLEFGNRWIPVTVNTETSSKNFGNLYGELSMVIYLFNYSGIKEKLFR